MIGMMTRDFLARAGVHVPKQVDADVAIMQVIYEDVRPAVQTYVASRGKATLLLTVEGYIEKCVGSVILNLALVVMWMHDDPDAIAQVMLQYIVQDVYLYRCGSAAKSGLRPKRSIAARS